MALFLDALKCCNKGRPPIWLMRQAGRYMPEYQAIRRKYSLIDMFHNPEVMVEVTKLPLSLLGVDAAILFADILSVCDGLGAEWNFKEGVGPVLECDLKALCRHDPTRVYRHTREAIETLKASIKVPLIGFAGGPFTVASYLIEGGSSRDLSKTKALLYSDPQAFHYLLEQITEATLDYLRVQIEAGVDAIQLFDSWAGQLDLEAFRTFSLSYLQKIVEQIPLPVILFCRGSSLFAEELATASPQAISLDWNGSLATIRKKIPPSIACQGNLDPAILLGSKESVMKAAKRILEEMEGEPGFIFNLGHGVLPGTPFENVQTLVDYVTAQVS